MASHEPVQLAFNSVEPDGCDKNKAPIIFLHGITSSKDQWHEIPEIIAKATNRKVYALDARNHGGSPWCEMPDFECTIGDLLGFMDSIDAPKAIIVGHSMGGITGMLTALRAPERVEQLVVEDMTCRKMPDSMIDLMLLIGSLGQAALALVPPALDEETAMKMILDGALQSLPQELKRLVKPDQANFRIQLKRNPEGRWAFKYNISVLLKALSNSRDFLAKETGAYEGPACFIYGKLSPLLVSQDEQNIKKYFPNVQMIGIENASHSVHSDCPRDFTNALLTFLQS